MADDDTNPNNDELLQPRKRVARPLSTVVQTFSADLDSMFGLNAAMDDLVQTVELKKETVSSSERELEALEARLRETEQRLAHASNSRHSSPSRAPPAPPPPPPSDSAPAQHPLAQRPAYPDSRPPTAPQRPESRRAPDTETLMQAMPGALPPDHPPPPPPPQYAGPGSSSEYVMVDRSGGARERGYA